MMFVVDFDPRNSFRFKWARLTTEATFHQTKHGPTQQTMLTLTTFTLHSYVQFQLCNMINKIPNNLAISSY